jgi:hypothetical protein
VVDRYQGRRLNSPNDVVVKRDGSIWFTDPPYGILSDREGHRADSELGDCYVFRFDPASGALRIVSDWLEEPNGLAFSPDERVLYVSDTSAALRSDGGGHHHIVAFDVVGGQDLANPRVFAVVDPGLADGLRVDVHGFVYTSSADSVQVYHPDGTRIGRIPVPEKVGNLVFGGAAGNELFICASTRSTTSCWAHAGPRPDHEPPAQTAQGRTVSADGALAWMMAPLSGAATHSIEPWAYWHARLMVLAGACWCRWVPCRRVTSRCCRASAGRSSWTASPGGARTAGCSGAACWR